jgi:inositol polyphosphate 5-phosphatase INPP5J/K
MSLRQSPITNKMLLCLSYQRKLTTLIHLFLHIFSLYVVTWNVAQKYPDYISLNDLLDIDDSIKDKPQPDVFIVGLQEINANPQNVVSAFFKADPWVQKLKDLLKPLDYLVAKTEQMQGLLMTVFVKRKHLYHIREIESEYTRTGFGGMWVSC